MDSALTPLLWFAAGHALSAAMPDFATQARAAWPAMSVSATPFSDPP